MVETGNRGYGRNFTKVKLDGVMCPSGSLVNVAIVGRDGDSLVGRAHAEGAHDI